MGCNLSAPSVDDEESLARTVPVSGTPPRPNLHKPRVHDVNRRSGILQDRFPGSPQQGKGGALLNKFGEREESVGSPSFRCYVKNGMQTDGKDFVTAICEQKKANRRFSNSPLRNETASPFLSYQEAELKSHKKEKAWMSRVLSKRDSN